MQLITPGLCLLMNKSVFNSILLVDLDLLIFKVSFLDKARLADRIGKAVMVFGETFGK